MKTVFCTIERLAFGGDGIAHTCEGKTLFVPFSAPGDKLEVEITQDKPRFARGQIKNILTPSPQRAPPRCPYYGTCGGCQLQHLSYESQLKAKTQFLRDALERIARLEIPFTLHGAEQHWEYRRHLQLHQQGDKIGFFSTDNKSLVDIDSCALYGPQFKKQPGRQLKCTSFDLLGLQITASPTAFLQAHPEMSEKLYARFLELALSTGATSALDLYCGIGATTLLLSRAGLAAHGIDNNPHAIELARQNASANNLAATFEATDAQPAPTPLLIANPPRTGLPFTPTAPHLLYISCMPPTFARDLGRLTEAGYEVASLEAFDLFPQTTHLEVLAHLKKKG